MDDVDALLNKNEDKSKIEPETPKEDGTAKVYEVNGRKYTPDEIDKMASDFQASERERGRLAEEVGKARKTPTLTETTEDLVPEVDKKKAKEVLGYVTTEDLDIRDYVKDATKEVNRLSKEYGIKSDDLFQEMIDLNRRVPVEKLETLLKVTHPDEYEKKRQAAIAADRPATPYTERTIKQGVEIPRAEPSSFRKGNTVARALEEIGAKE